MNGCDMIFYSWKQVDGEPGLKHRRIALSAYVDYARKETWEKVQN